MIHPLINDLSKFKDVEIEDKMRQLTSNYYKTTNATVRNQISVIMDIYREELAKRQAKQWQDQVQKRNSDLDNLINVS